MNKKPKRHIAVKSIVGIVLLLVTFAVIVSIIGYRSFSEALLNQYTEGAFLTAKAAARLVDSDHIDEYVGSGGTGEKYEETWAALDSLCNTSGSTFIYVILPDRTDYAHITFLFSTIDHNSSYTVYSFGYLRDTTNDEYREKYRNIYELRSERELVIRNKGYIETGNHITAMIGLKDYKGDVQAILCVQRQMDVMSKTLSSYMHRIYLVLVIMALLVITGQALYLHRVLLKPINQISEEAERFSTENKPAEKRLQELIKSNDEIGVLAGSIDRMEDQIQDYVDNITRITAEKERINTELNLATRIQAAMLPHIFPPFPDRPEFDIYASMDPAKEVGGDFYDYFLIDEDHLGLVIADVSGKGVPAALFMMASKIILASAAKMGKSPAQILTDTNAAICANNHEEMFITVWLGILEISTGRLTAANAGHEYPVLCAPGALYELFKDKHGFVIGGMDNIKYKEYELTLEPGSRLFIYTDGVPEATDGEGNMFGTGRMLDALNRETRACPKDVLRNVRAAVDDFVKDAEQFDDLTMLCLEYRGKQ